MDSISQFSREIRAARTGTAHPEIRKVSQKWLTDRVLRIGCRWTNPSLEDRGLIVPILLFHLLSVSVVKETVWWDTPGGKVTEHHVDNGASCSLMFYDDNGSVTFEWDDPNRILVTAISWDWQFPANWDVPVAMQFGDAWLSNHSNSAVMKGVGHGNSVAFTTDHAIDDLLLPARRIIVKTTNSDMTIRLQPHKTSALLSHTHLCRSAIRK